ncbi:hypothetical protein TEA_010095 [Camellia sinensis var. sinensis]|uniref:Uncharacterized protein n=1 Tax=Camellia sinensis var. sinensis TaxID=542762 RepID=A0A4S4DNM0_CAMSN|nr:hypothetical protein TEA_010095 [Camellia sinensis var. sinensis]
MDSSSSSSSSSSSQAASSSMHLALAALFGASVMAISAFYIHKRTVDQVLDRLIKLRRRCPSSATAVAADDQLFASEDDGGGSYFVSDGEIEIDRNTARSLDENVLLSSYRVSSSMPNVGQDQSMWVGSGGRLMTPRSSGGYAFGSAGDSDDEGTELATGEDLYTYENIDSSAECINLNDNSSNIQNLSASPFNDDNRSCILEQKNRAIANEAKENVDQYGDGKADTTSMRIMGNDPSLTNIILPLTATVHESMNKEEEEVWKMIRDCLDLREKYVYREVAPWIKATVGESCASGTKNDPLCFVPVEATAHHFRMEDGVVHVYASENGSLSLSLSDSTDLFPVASSTTFFTDMHHLLKVMSVGNVRSACHHRLRFLEEKFRLHLLVNADREFLAQKSAPHRDFYNIRKVDTHVHHSACMNQKHLLRFIKSKLRKEPDEVVIFRDGIYLTLKEVFESLQLTGLACLLFC